MRFAANPQPKPPVPRMPAAEIIRRIVAGESLARAMPAVAPLAQDLPAELDQRVRLVGEW